MSHPNRNINIWKPAEFSMPSSTVLLTKHDGTTSVSSVVGEAAYPVVLWCKVGIQRFRQRWWRGWLCDFRGIHWGYFTCNVFLTIFRLSVDVGKGPHKGRNVCHSLRHALYLQTVLKIMKHLSLQTLHRTLSYLWRQGRELPLDAVSVAVFYEARIQGPWVIYQAKHSSNVWH